MASNRKITSTKADKRSATAPDVVVVEKKGISLEAGVAIITTILLLVAILLVDKDLASKFGHGTFF